MPTATRRRPRPSASADSNASSDQPPVRGPATSREHPPNSSDDDTGSDEQQVAAGITFQSNMNADIPSSIAAALERMRRNMELNFQTLHDAIEEQRKDTNTRFKETDKRFEEQRTETDKRFEEQRSETDKRFEEQRTETAKRFEEQRIFTKEMFTALRTHTDHFNANRGSTHIYSGIHPVGRINETTGQVLIPNGFPTRVHQFLRLKTQSRWSVLVNLIRFYEIQSWPTWGLYSMWPEDESETEELLAPEHHTMEDAVQFAPEIALRELARVIGLDYDKITINREEDERVQEMRVINRKRVLPEASQAAKPEKTSRVRAPEQATTLLNQHSSSEKPKSFATSSGAVLGWDSRDPEHRTPPEEKPRVRDAPRYRKRTPSPTSVATSSGERIPTRNKP